MTKYDEHAPPRKPGVEKVDSEMQHLMAPFINAMRKEFMPRWPHLDPEMVLLHFLYLRNNMEPPQISLARKPRPPARGQRNQYSASQGRADELPPRPASSMDFSSNQRGIDTLPPRPASSMDVRPSKNEAVIAPERPQSSLATYGRPQSRSDQADDSRPISPSSRPISARCGSALSMERPESNLSFYKARAGAESRASASTRACDSRSSNRFADTPTDDPDNDDIDYYDHQFAKKMQNARAIEPCRDRGHFRDFKLPERSIDDCSDTHYSIRHSSCLRERLEARRYQAFHGLGNCASGLKKLDKILLAAEEDELNAMERPESPRKVVGGFSMQIARTRQGLRGQFISKVPILSLDILTEEEQFWVVGKLRPKNYEKHSKIFIQGETGHELFIIESGTCIVTKEVYGDIMRICEMKPGEFFGEMAVIYDIPRTATITAATTVKLLALSRKDIATVVSAASLEKMKSMTRMQLLLAIPGLAKLTFEQRAKFVGALRDESYPAGTEIMREGYRTGQTAEFGSNRRLLLLEDGVCSESRTNNYANMCDSRLLSGNYFGLVELFYGGPHQSTVVAQTDVKLLSISWEDLQSFLTAEAVSVFETMQRSLRILLLRQAHPLLHDKNDQTLTTVLAQGTFRRFAPWHVILRKGEPISCLMMLEEGTCVEHDGDLGTLMEDYGQDRERGNEDATNQYEGRSSDGVKSREHTRPGDSLESIDAIVAPWTLVATTTCSVLFVPIQVLRRLRQQSGSLRQQSGSLGSSKEFQ